MAKTEPKNEQVLCDAVAALLAQREGEFVLRKTMVDTLVRDRPSVEAMYDTQSSRFAVEHTRIESFQDQIGLGKQFAQLLAPLENELRGKLPGVYFLIFGVGEARVAFADQAKVRAAISTWIVDNAGALEPEERVGHTGRCEIIATPDGVPFEVILRRDCDYDSGLFIIQSLLGDRQQMRRDAIRRALNNKCPKLKAARDEGHVSVLILESDDVSLANRVVVAEAAAAELSTRDDQPDKVVWVRTSTRRWKAALIKDSANLYPNIDGMLVDISNLTSRLRTACSPQRVE